jgi:glycosyltransferase involved in cell wall biosynthesis
LHSHTAGGAERHLLQLMRALSASGIKCIYAGPRDSWLGRELVADGFQCQHIGYKGLFDIVSLVRLTLLIMREGPDIVHGHLTRGAFYSGLASKFTRVPNVATAHSTNAGRRFGFATRIIAVSDAVHTFLLDYGYRASVLRTVSHGVPDGAAIGGSSRDAVRDCLQLGDGPVLMMAARFVPDKGQDLALRALARLSHLDWTLLLAGSLDTNYANKMQQLAADLGISDRVRFVGHRDDIGDIYRCADILLAPSRREALSLTLLEAACFGIPIIASDVGGIGEAVENGVTGFLVDSEDIDALTKQIRRLLGDKDMRQTMGAAGRRRYEEMFGLERMAQETLRVYEELCARGVP